MADKQKNKQLIAIYTEEGAYLEESTSSIRGALYDQDLYKEFDNDFFTALLHFGFKDGSAVMTQSLNFLYLLSTAFIRDAEAHYDYDMPFLCEPPDKMTEYQLLNSIPLALGSEYINATWLSRIWEGLCLALEKELEKFDGNLQNYIIHNKSGDNLFSKVYFHLIEVEDSEYPFAFLATFGKKQGTEKKSEHLPLKLVFSEFENDDEGLLDVLYPIDQAGEESSFIKALLDSGEIFHSLEFSADEAYRFLTEIPIYESNGITCRIPDWWKNKKKGVGVQVAMGEKKQSLLGLETLISIIPSLTIDGEQISQEEIDRLMNMTDGLIMIKGKWVDVDHDKLARAISIFDQYKEMNNISVATALRMEIGLHKDNNLHLQSEGEDEDEEVVSVTNGEWLNGVISTLVDPPSVSDVDLPDSFDASLRDYQKRGFNWLMTMYSYKFGALLADDMGLGKTIQILAMLDYFRAHSDKKTLLVIPVSLITNWSNEIQRFAPELKYSIIHNKYDGNLSDESDLFITTYSMIKAKGEVHEVDWDILILDEAQAIKNPGAKQTRAIKQLRGKFRIALTGTPIENRLGDLWSIFDFLNPGLLGNMNEFNQYIKSDDEHKVHGKLRDAIRPFILRRLKTDKKVITDLPPKIELKAYSELSSKQVQLYKHVVKELEVAVLEEEGIKRKGLVLSALMKFKQICNHPSHFMGQQAYKAKDSGKFQKLEEICETIREKHEKVLVFTQFKEIVQPLSDYMEEIFQKSGLIFHGSIPTEKRGGIIKEFNENEHIPFMVLSLKAGGTGLNLTAANHVIHFDRWWNPAIEDQATDRAFRIGQSKKVIVHKLVTKNTLEEKIDLMLEEKKGLAENIVDSNQERWITEFDNDELLELVQLS